MSGFNIFQHEKVEAIAGAKVGEKMGANWGTTQVDVKVYAIVDINMDEKHDAK